MGVALLRRLNRSEDATLRFNFRESKPPIPRFSSGDLAREGLRVPYPTSSTRRITMIDDARIIVGLAIGLIAILRIEFYDDVCKKLRQRSKMKTMA
jgi:hypothetical protein